MGGRLAVHLALPASRADLDPERDARRVVGRVRAWAARLTRFTETSDLARLNAGGGSEAVVRPTLGCCLGVAADASRLTGGIVDVGLLDARLAAEAGTPLPDRQTSGGGWSVQRSGRGAIVRRADDLRFDLDGVAKGWLADRALDLLDRYPGVIVDGDGDLAIRVAPGDRWEVGIEDPRADDLDLAVLSLTAEDANGRPARFGLATSGTSVHRWGAAHHLVDPRTGRPAVTDVVQATVLAGSARSAEAWAKTAVVLGSLAALDTLDRARVTGAILLTERGEILALPQTTRWIR
jgi:thiamine biosynthesis lipoprotein